MPSIQRLGASAGVGKWKATACKERASDIVIVDRGREAEHGDVVIAAVNSEPVCKRLHRRDGVVILKSENPAYPPRYIMEGDELVIWGVVRYSVRDHAQ